MNVRVLGVLAGLLVLPWSTAAAQCSRGSLVAEVTHVRDGDTIEVGSVPIRLQGLAAPERGEPGGDEATAAMRAMVLGRELRCDLDGDHTHDRSQGSVFEGERWPLWNRQRGIFKPRGLPFLPERQDQNPAVNSLETVRCGFMPRLGAGRAAPL